MADLNTAGLGPPAEPVSQNEPQPIATTPAPAATAPAQEPTLPAQAPDEAASAAIQEQTTPGNPAATVAATGTDVIDAGALGGQALPGPTNPRASTGPETVGSVPAIATAPIAGPATTDVAPANTRGVLLPCPRLFSIVGFFHNYPRTACLYLFVALIDACLLQRVLKMKL